MKKKCDLIRAVPYKGETGCVKLTCDVMTAVLFEGGTVCI